MYIGHTGLLAMDDTLITTLNILMCMIWEYIMCMIWEYCLENNL